MNRVKKQNNSEMDLEHCLVESSYDLARRKMPLFYKKLVVPMRMRSVYWKYFGFPAGDDGTILTKDKIVCVICKTQMIYNRNTSNLRMHLHSKHKSIFRKLEVEEGEKGINIVNGNKRIKAATNKNVFTRSLDETIEFQNLGSNRKSGDNKDVQVVMTEEVNETDISNIAIIFPSNEELTEYNEEQMQNVNQESSDAADSTEMSEAVVNFIITDLLPTSIVEGKGFHNLLSSLSNKTVMIPNEKKIVEDILPNLYSSYKEQIYGSIISNCVSNISISVEEWKTVDDLKCLSIYMHYLQNGEPRLFTKLLTSVCCTGLETEEHWVTIVEKIFTEWCINSSAITGVVVSSDNEELKKALRSKSMVVLPCFLFVLQKLCSEHCFNKREIAELLEKCRQLVKLVHELKVDIYDQVLGGEIEDEDYDENDDCILNYDRPDLWFTTYYMLRGMLKKKNHILQILKDSCRIGLIQSSDWKTIEDLVDLLEPLKTIVITLFEEKNPSVSLVKPLIWKVNSAKFELEDDDSTLLKQLKTSMKNYLNESYSDITVDHLTQVATTLDPRFKNFIQQDEHFNGGESLTDLLANLVETEGSLAPEESTSTSTGKTSTLDKNRRSSGINTLFGNFCVKKAPLTAQDKVQMEVQYYQDANSALLEECPLEWWQRMNKCPNLVRLAHKYHCVPAILIFSNGRSIRDYTSYYFKRACLKMNIIDQMLFLHSNRILS